MKEQVAKLTIQAPQVQAAEVLTDRSESLNAMFIACPPQLSANFVDCMNCVAIGVLIKQ